MTMILGNEIGRLNAFGANAPTTARIPMLDSATGEARYLTANEIASGANAVDGPSSATPNAIALFDGPSGKIIQNSAATLDPVTGVMSIPATTNQLILGTANTTTLNAAAPSAPRVITLPDAGADGKAVLAGGNTAVTLTGTGDTSTGTMTTLSAQVTSASITTAGGATHVATITYTGIAATDMVFITKAGGTNIATEDYSYKAICTTNTITVTLSNNTAATALNGTVIFNILVVKA